MKNFNLNILSRIFIGSRVGYSLVNNIHVPVGITNILEYEDLLNDEGRYTPTVDFSCFRCGTLQTIDVRTYSENCGVMCEKCTQNTLLLRLRNGKELRNKDYIYNYWVTILKELDRKFFTSNIKESLVTQFLIENDWFYQSKHFPKYFEELTTEQNEKFMNFYNWFMGRTKDEPIFYEMITYNLREIVDLSRKRKLLKLEKEEDVKFTENYLASHGVLGQRSRKFFEDSGMAIMDIESFLFVSSNNSIAHLGVYPYYRYNKHFSLSIDKAYKIWLKVFKMQALIKGIKE